MNNASVLEGVQLSSVININEYTNLVTQKKQIIVDDIENDRCNINTENNPISTSSLFMIKYGKLLGFLIDKGNPGIVIGDLFPLCLFFNALLSFFVAYFLFNTIHWLLFSLGIIISCFQNVCFAYASMADPGVPKAEYEKMIFDDDDNKNFRKCKDCEKWINTEEGTIHCTICKICIEGYDHHCSLMNKCIGKNNLKAFYLYVLGSFLLILFFVIGFLVHEV